jgi:hypothetical protein
VGEVFYMPVWGGLRDGLMVANAQYNRTYIETALAEETGKSDCQKDSLIHSKAF